MTGNSKLYKSFRTQGQECRKSGNSYFEKCRWCGQDMIICKKYGGQCSSQKCLPERTSKAALIKEILEEVKK